MTERRRYEFVLEAASPIAHHAQNFGNEALIFRRRMRFDGGWAQVPYITADTMRHGMREAAAYALLDAAGLLKDAQLSEAALRLLFAGGMVTGRGDGSTIKLDNYREMCDLVPSMGLFGGCAENRMIPGRLIVDDAMLICEESARYIPDWAIEFATERAGVDTCRAHIEREQRVRMDPTLIPQNRLLLNEGERAAIEGRLLESESAHEGDDAPARESTKSTMMPRTAEVIAPGSLFFWATEAICNDDLEIDTFHVSIGCFLVSARVGGKRGTGHGSLKPIEARRLTVGSTAKPIRVDVELPEDSREIVDPAKLAKKPGDLFRQHVHARADRIRSFLGEVNA
jgi:hypothetical protein